MFANADPAGSRARDPAQTACPDSRKGGPVLPCPVAFDFRAELDRLAVRVDRHPLTEVISYEVNPSATLDHIRDCESKFGATLPQPVVDFYRSIDGAIFRWRFRKDLDDAQRQSVLDAFAPMTNTPQYAFGVAGAIEMVPLADTLLHEDYTLPQIEEPNDEFVFAGTTYTDNEFCGMLRLFDVVSDSSAMAFVAQPNVANWKMLWLTDDWMVYDCSRVTWLDDYLRLMIATWGLITARDNLFVEYDGHLEKPVLFSPELATPLVPEILSTP